MIGWEIFWMSREKHTYNMQRQRRVFSQVVFSQFLNVASTILIENVSLKFHSCAPEKKVGKLVLYRLCIAMQSVLSSSSFWLCHDYLNSVSAVLVSGDERHTWNCSRLDSFNASLWTLESGQSGWALDAWRSNPFSTTIGSVFFTRKCLILIAS